MRRRVVTLYLQDEEYEFLRAYAYEQRKSMSAVLKECLAGLRGKKEAEVGAWPQLCRDAGRAHSPARKNEVSPLDREQELVQKEGPRGIR